MVLIPDGTFEMGCKDCKLEDALPLHPVSISSFWMDATPVTNASFRKFVQQTGYKTIAERPLQPKDYPGVPVDKLVSGSAVFSQPTQLASLANAMDWWSYVPGAAWHHPEGPSSGIRERMEHPAVHIAYADAEAYCQWADGRLPTEAEFEYAARGGLKGKRYAWGDELKPRGRWPANIWQGKFPTQNAAEDGYTQTSPVRAFPPNGYGLYDMGGNVWQWTADWYRPDTYAVDAVQGVVPNPRGPNSSQDPGEPGVPKRVQRGGSFLCSDHYCTRYLVGSRGKGAVDSAGSNIGFRCVKSKN
ncbi:MAG TPA: formylglycine-generating enzyme family protein [Oligoflexus sp.]|nr:formylglycine-generating enzyme family protein [Oligoflexus sp.]